MKIPWPEDYKLLDKILATFALIVIIFAWGAGFVLGIYFYFFGG